MYVKVRVIAGAKKEVLEKRKKDLLRVAGREPAERNLANGRVVELVAAHYRMPKNKVRIISGHRSQSKILAIQ